MSDSEKQAIEYLKNYSIWNQSQGFSRGKNDRAIETVLNLIEKKDKIIDLMAKYISETDMEEDICFSIDCDENTDVDTGEVDCKTCIKEYFKKKVSKP